MATVVSITNPITGAVEQVDKLDHTAQQIDDAVALAPQLSNLNLLDNWYFATPVNQRGQVKYTKSWEYGIDRWLCAGDGKVTIAEGHCVFYGAVDQGLSVEMPDILGCTMTASVLLTDGTLITGTAVNTDNSIDIPFVSGVSGVHLALNATALSNHRRFRTYIVPERAVVAVKLELGSQQTLAHQDSDGNWVLNEIPDYGEQLRRCQRYFQTFATESLRPTNAIDFRPVMRVTPALSTITVGGKTLYTAIADL